MRTRRNKDEIRCTGCGALTESVSYHPITKTGSYCDSCAAQNNSGQPLLPVRSMRVDIRRDDGEPLYSHQVARDVTSARRTVLCVNPECDIKMAGHSHYVK